MLKRKSNLFIIALAVVTVLSLVAAIDAASGPVSGAGFWRLWE